MTKAKTIKRVKLISPNSTSSNHPVIRSHDARRVLNIGFLQIMIGFLINNCNSHRADTVARGTRDLKFLDTSRHSTADTGDRYELCLRKG